MARGRHRFPPEPFMIIMTAIILMEAVIGIAALVLRLAG